MERKWVAGIPKSPDEYVSLMEESGIVSPGELVEFVRRLGANGQVPADAKATAERAIALGLLTPFQAHQLLMGRSKGFVLGRYRIMGILGVGAMGRVFLAEHLLMSRQVALKTLPIKRTSEASASERFQREARAIGALNHPNIVQAYDFDHSGNLWYLVLEYVNGKSLQEFVHRHGPVPWQQACDMIAQAAAGLQHAADLGVVHRDIKPGNLLLDRTGIVKVLDMGLARIFGEFLEKGEQPLTVKYDERVLGTADYLAPEQAEDSHTVDTRADIYSLGLTLHYLLTGKAAVREGTVAEKLIWHQTQSPTPIRELRPDVPQELADILAKMTARKPADRFQFPSEVRKALQQLLVEVRASFELTTQVRRLRAY
jgi:serine/threonine protein kinase